MMEQSYIDQTLSLFKPPHPIAMSGEDVANFLIKFNSYLKGDIEPISYADIVKSITAEYSGETEVSITNDYSDLSSGDKIAFYPIIDTISYDSWWYFSTKQLVEDITAAENNDNIIAHLLLINSPGGVTYYLNEVVKKMQGLKKPIYVVCEQLMASAGLWIASGADKIYCLNEFDMVGSIGIMISFADYSKYYEQMGIKLIEEYASKSTHKNRDYKNLVEGNSEEYVKKFMDPLCEVFIADVKRGRPKTVKAAEESHVFNGEVFYAKEAEELGLIDGIKSFNDVLIELIALGTETKQKRILQEQLLTYI